MRRPETLKRIYLYRYNKPTNIFTVVDDKDYSRLNKSLWFLGKKGYVVRHNYHGKPRDIKMHNEIMNPDTGFLVDHEDLNPLNNLRSNLRIATKQQNNMNVGTKRNTAHGFKGVRLVGRRWKAEIRYNERTLYLGYYDSIVEAARAYNEAALKLHGQFARLNDLSAPIEPERLAA
jgi:AP2 domain